MKDLKRSARYVVHELADGNRATALKIVPTPTIELIADRAYLHLDHAGIATPLVFEWTNYPEAFAAYMNELQKGRVEVSGLRLISK